MNTQHANTKIITIQLWQEDCPSFVCLEESPKDLNDTHYKVDEREFEVEGDTQEKMWIAACEQYFELSQNVNQPWKYPYRSTSVGDLMMIIDRQTNVGIALFCVDNIGYKRLK